MARDKLQSSLDEIASHIERTIARAVNQGRLSASEVSAALNPVAKYLRQVASLDDGDALIPEDVVVGYANRKMGTDLKTVPEMNAYLNEHPEKRRLMDPDLGLGLVKR